jgi:hypothetical protein
VESPRSSLLRFAANKKTVFERQLEAVKNKSIVARSDFLSGRAKNSRRESKNKNTAPDAGCAWSCNTRLYR